jgi:hypothetical protein
VKIRTVIIVAGTALALVAPTAHAATAKVLPAHKPAVHHTAKGAKSKDTSSSVRIVSPRFIYIAPQQPASSDPGVNDCQAYMVGCTDEQLCEIWGFNCDVTVLPAIDVQAAPAEPSARQPSTETAGLVESTSNASTATAAAADSSSDDDCGY